MLLPRALFLLCSVVGIAAQVSGAFRAPALPILNGAVIPPAHSYLTVFPKAESPISENGSWITGGSVGLDWADVQTRVGIAFGGRTSLQYADPTAVLAGIWASDQQVEGVVTVGQNASSCCREVELRLRTVITAHAITGYEVLCSIVAEFPYIQIVRWNGPLGDFSYLGETKEGCRKGDVLKAVINDTRIVVYKNGNQVLEAVDDHFRNGNPGMGFYDTTQGIWTKLGLQTDQDFGFARFSAADLAP